MRSIGLGDDPSIRLRMDKTAGATVDSGSASGSGSESPGRGSGSRCGDVRGATQAENLLAEFAQACHAIRGKAPRSWDGGDCRNAKRHRAPSNDTVRSESSGDACRDRKVSCQEHSSGSGGEAGSQQEDAGSRTGSRSDGADGETRPQDTGSGSDNNLQSGLNQNSDLDNLYAPGTQEHMVYKYIKEHSNMDTKGSDGQLMVELPGQTSSESLPMTLWQLYNHVSALRRQNWGTAMQHTEPLQPASTSLPPVAAPPIPPAATFLPTATLAPKISMLSETQEIMQPTGAQVQGLDDGYKWRKYGQKGLKSPDGTIEVIKSYYRCNVHGCPMRKQVEKYAHNDQVRVVHFLGSAHNHAPTPGDSQALTSMWPTAPEEVAVPAA